MISYHGSSLENRLFSQDIIDFQKNSTNTAGSSKTAKIKAHGNFLFESENLHKCIYLYFFS
jgi:hypothetical protein